MAPEKKDIDAREFEGRVVLVTGAATGLGSVIAQEFHARGAFTVMVDQSSEVEKRASSLSSSRVLGITATEVNPPATADWQPVSIVSLYSNPGSRK